MKQFTQERLYVPELNNIGYSNTNYTKRGCSVAQQSPLAMGVTVSSGVVVFNSTSQVDVSGGDLTIDTADTSDRIDMVAVNNAGTASILKGSVNIVDPTIPETADYDPDDYVILSRVLIEASVTQIIDSNITDIRIINPNINTQTKSQDGTYATVSVSSVATIVLSSDITRINSLIYNNSSVDIYIGAATVTTSDGYLLAAGKSYEYRDPDQIYAIHEDLSGQDMRYIEFKR